MGTVCWLFVYCMLDLLVKEPKGYFTNKADLRLEQGYLTSGGRLNKKDGLTRYGDSHVKDKTS